MQNCIASLLKRIRPAGARGEASGGAWRPGRGGVRRRGQRRRGGPSSGGPRGRAWRRGGRAWRCGASPLAAPRRGLAEPSSNRRRAPRRRHDTPAPSLLFRLCPSLHKRRARGTAGGDAYAFAFRLLETMIFSCEMNLLCMRQMEECLSHFAFSCWSQSNRNRLQEGFGMNTCHPEALA